MDGVDRQGQWKISYKMIQKRNACTHNGGDVPMYTWKIGIRESWSKFLASHLNIELFEEITKA